MEKGPYKTAKTRAPDLDKYVDPSLECDFVSYGKGSKMYSLQYWSFVRLAKEAGVVTTLRKTAVVDLKILDAYMEEQKREEVKTSKGIIMATSPIVIVKDKLIIA